MIKRSAKYSSNFISNCIIIIGLNYDGFFINFSNNMITLRNNLQNGSPWFLELEAQSFPTVP